jgi:hypothetical protein
MHKKTHHVSYPANEKDLYNEIERQSAISYIPAATLIRYFVREGMKNCKSAVGAFKYDL